MTNDNRLNPSSGRVPQALAGGVTYLLTPSSQLPAFKGPVWDSGKIDMLYQEEWIPSQQGWFLKHMVPGRMGICLLSLLAGLTVFLWSRALWGDIPGLFALTLYTFCPTMLANGAIITSDMSAALFFTLTIAFAWRLVNRPCLLNIGLTGLAGAGAALSKFSFPILVPMVLILLLLTTLRPRSHSNRSMRARTLSVLTGFAGLLLAAATAFVLIWASYTFRFGALAPDQPPTDCVQAHWAVMQAIPGNASRLLAFLNEHKILPQAYLLGANIIVSATTERYAFFDGQVSHRGWYWYFPVSLIVKTPLATLAVFALAGLLALRNLAGTLFTPQRSLKLKKLRLALYRSAPLWVLIIVYLGVSILSRHNMGHRYLAPVYPALYILAASVASLFFHRQSLLRLFPIVIAVVLTLESLLIWPNYLAYINPLGGGPDRGYRTFVDSSLDWGQDLPALKSWLHASGLESPGAPPVYVSYFGPSTIAHFDIHAQQIYSFDSPSSVPQVPAPWKPGVFCISATMLQSIFTEFPGEWNSQYEERYRQLQKAVVEFAATEPDSFARQQLIAKYGIAQYYHLFTKYECARFSRLAAWLRQGEPDAQINHSILIYKLTDKDLAAALD